MTSQAYTNLVTLWRGWASDWRAMAARMKTITNPTERLYSNGEIKRLETEAAIYENCAKQLDRVMRGLPPVPEPDDTLF